MWENMKFKSNASSTTYLPAYFVFSVGIVGCSLAALFLFNDFPDTAWYVLGGLVCLALGSLWLRRVDLPSSTLLGIFGTRRHELSVDYVPRRKETQSLQFGTNRPPTVEDIREACDGPNNWVPSRLPSGRRSVRQR
jgi:hypothetical protein